MSLLRNPPHVAYVQNRANTRDASGVRVYAPVGDKVKVKCLAEPVREWSTAEEDLSVGLQVVNLMVIRARTWPGDVNSHIEFEGDLYETVGVPQHFNFSRRTRHYRVTARWVGKAT